MIDEMMIDKKRKVERITELMNEYGLDYVDECKDRFDNYKEIVSRGMVIDKINLVIEIMSRNNNIFFIIMTLQTCCGGISSDDQNMKRGRMPYMIRNCYSDQEQWSLSLLVKRIVAMKIDTMEARKVNV